MKITCLVANCAQLSSRLWGEHGIAFLIETGAGVPVAGVPVAGEPATGVLFDTGQSGTVLIHNMQALNLDPRQIDAVAISHAHDDHMGGLPDFLRAAQPHLPLYANPDLFQERYSRRGESIRKIGPPMAREALADRTELHQHADAQEIVPGVWTTGEIAERPYPQGSSLRHQVHTAEGWAPDPYQDDMSLVVATEAGLILLCGCCHAGLLNTLAHVERVFSRAAADSRLPSGEIIAIAGGTHLAHADDAHLAQLIAKLETMPSLRRIYLNHCSGTAALFALQQVFGLDVVQPCPAGTVLDLGGDL